MFKHELGHAPGGATEAETIAALEGLFSDDSEDPQAGDAPQDESSHEETPAPEGDDEEQHDDAPEDTDEEPKVDDEEQDQEPVKPRTRKLKVDGEEIEVTDEELEKGYSRTADYTRKTQKLSEERKAFEAEQQGVRAERVRYAEQLTQLETAVKSLAQEPDWEKLQQELPAGEFAAMFSRWQVHSKRVQAIEAERQAAERAVLNDEITAFNTHIDGEKAKLLEAIPAWKDPEVAKKDKADILEYGQSLGFSENDIKSVIDHRAILALRKSMLFDRAEKARAAARPAAKSKLEQVRTAPPGSTSGNRPKVSEATRARQRHAKTGSLDSAAAAISHMLLD